MLHSLEESTRKTYAAGLARLTEFCDARGYSEEARMPASADLLALFIASWAGRVSESTIGNWLAGIHFWHDVNGAPWHGEGSDVLSRARKGAANMVPLSSKRAKRPPVTKEHMDTLHQGLDHDDPFDAAVWATASIAFWSCCRLGELTVSGAARDFRTRHHVSRGTPYRFARTPPTHSTPSNDYVTIPIPWTKTTGSSGADIIVTARPGDPLCPFSAFTRHISINFALTPSAPLFAYNDPNGTLGYSVLTKDAFMSRCNSVWVAGGLPSMQGHGFRIGGATHLLLLGVHPDIVSAQGRWKSRAFMDYWREVDQILPLFLTQHNTNVSHTSIRNSMRSFASRHGVPRSRR